MKKYISRWLKLSTIEKLGTIPVVALLIVIAPIYLLCYVVKSGFDGIEKVQSNS